METENLKQSPLLDRHVAAGARLVPFAGWNMPVQYKGILDEHRGVRESAGVFDISHMGEFFVRGETAVDWLDSMLTNKVAALGIGEGQYTLMLNERGGVIDDLLVYRIEQDAFLLVVNASKIDEDFAWLSSHAPSDVELRNESDAYAGLAIQGPKSAAIFASVFGGELPARNHIAALGGQAGGFVARTGYTGEDGFEVFVPAAKGGETWDALLAAGAMPAGLGARDTLRLEMCYPLNGSDLSPDHTPLEAGLGFFVHLEKGDFIGKTSLLEQKGAGLSRRLAAIEVREKSPPLRSHYPVWADGKAVGETSSGALSPSLGYGIALAYLPVESAAPGSAVEIEIRGRRFPGVVVKKPFLRKP